MRGLLFNSGRGTETNNLYSHLLDDDDANVSSAANYFCPSVIK